MTDTHQRVMAVYRDEDPGDVVGHLPHMIALLTGLGVRTRGLIALLTGLGVRTRGLRAGGASLLWPPNWTLRKMSRWRWRKVSLACETTVQGGSSEFDGNFGEEVCELLPLGALTDH